MKRMKLDDLPQGMRATLLEAIPTLRGREPDTLVRVLRPRDGFFHKADDLRDERRTTLVFSTVPWELHSPGGALRFQALEPVLLTPRVTRRTLLKVAVGTAAVAFLGFNLLSSRNYVQAEGLIQRFRNASTFAERADILTSVQGSKTQEARNLYIHILLQPWPANERAKMIKDALTGMETCGDQLLYTVACYYSLYAFVQDHDILEQAIYRLAGMKDPFLIKNLGHLRQAAPQIYAEAVKLVNN